MSKITLKLSQSEALVLFDWLARFNEDMNGGMDEAEQRILFDLESQLESILPEPLANDYKMLIEQAKNEIAGIAE